jgi:hypothetical protein
VSGGKSVQLSQPWHFGRQWMTPLIGSKQVVCFIHKNGIKFQLLQQVD